MLLYRHEDKITESKALINRILSINKFSQRFLLYETGYGTSKSSS
jgi:hypothetical protein